MSRINAAALSETTIETGTAIVGAGAAGLTLAGALDADSIVIESGADGIDMELQMKHRSIVSGHPTNPDSVRVRAIGGATTRWTGRCTELDSYDFEERPWISPTGWPIKRQDLAQWYAKAWAALAIDPPVEPAQCYDREGPVSGQDDALRECSWHYGTAANSPDLNFAHLFRGLFDNGSRRLIYAADAVELITDGREVKAIRIVDRNGVSRFVRARRFVLAAGCLDNTTLLLQKHETEPMFLGDASSWLGRGLMQHLRVRVGALSQNAAQFQALQQKFAIRKSRGRQRIEFGLALRPDFARPNGLGNASAFFEYETDLKRTHPMRVLSAARRLLGHPQLLPRGKANLFVDAEQAVTRDSRVTLHQRVGPSGLRRALVDWRVSSTDYRTAYKLIHETGRWLHANGYGALPDQDGIDPEYIDPKFILDSNHPLGGTRMSETPSSGVVDRDCRVHSCKNLWVLGGSVFSTGGHGNPTLTIVALAMRLADHLTAQTE